MPQPSGRLFKLADGKGLGDVEEAEEDEGDEGVTPVGGAAEQGDPLAGDFVDDHELRDRGGRIRGRRWWRRECRASSVRAMPASRASSRACGRGMEAPGEGGPEEHGGHRAPGAGTGLAEARAEEGGDGPGPRAVLVLVWSGAWAEAQFSSESPSCWPPLRPPRSSRTSGSRTGELIL